MKRIRIALLAAFTIAVLFNVAQAVLPMILQVWQPIDDWAYKAAMAEPSPQSQAPFWILGCWIMLELGRLVWLFNAFSIAIIVVTVAVLASVAGPMVGSITDQGRHSADMGFSAGGAKDVANFRQNIARGYLPQVSDLTFEGLFYDYAFDMTSSRGRPRSPVSGERKLFSPSYSCAVSRNPLTGEDESFLAVGLESDFSLDEISRKQLNLVVVLDISASMDAPFNGYYYDRQDTAGGPDGEPGEQNSKLEIACRNIVSLIDHLRPEDRLGIVLFDDDAYLAKPLRRIGETNVAALKRHVLEVRTGGCTNMEAGLTLGLGLLEPFAGADPDEVENRVVFLTDAMPNRSETGEDGLLEITRANALQRRHLTFVGVGVDFNSQLIKSITRIRGANYYSVHSAKEFKRRMDDEFELMVTPLVFDLELAVEAQGWSIERVYGSPEANEASGRLMYVNTLFPSKRDENGARGGLILLRMRRTSPVAGDLPGAASSDQLALTAAYEDRSGKRHAVRSVVEFPAWNADQYDNSGIRKGILLARYGDLIHDWICRERGIRVASINREKWQANLGRWERTSQSLRVSAAAGERFRLFREAFERERLALGDPALTQEGKVFDALVAHPGADDEWRGKE